VERLVRGRDDDDVAAGADRRVGRRVDFESLGVPEQREERKEVRLLRPAGEQHLVGAPAVPLADRVTEVGVAVRRDDVVEPARIEVEPARVQ